MQGAIQISEMSRAETYKVPVTGYQFPKHLILDVPGVFDGDLSVQGSIKARKGLYVKGTLTATEINVDGDIYVGKGIICPNIQFTGQAKIKGFIKDKGKA